MNSAGYGWRENDIQANFLFIRFFQLIIPFFFSLFSLKLNLNRYSEKSLIRQVDILAGRYSDVDIPRGWYFDTSLFRYVIIPIGRNSCVYEGVFFYL